MRRKILHLILAALVAFGLWLYVITTVNPGYETTFYDIPVVLTNESALADRGLMLDMKSTPTVTLKLSGNRSDLIRLDKGNIVITADLSRIREAGEQPLSYTITYPGDVAEGSIDVLSKLPGAITVTTVATDTKTIPINPQISGTVKDGYFDDQDDAILSAETVQIHGPAHILKDITQAVFYVDLNGRTESISETYTLIFCDNDKNPVETDRVTANISQVDLDLKIQRYKGVSLVLDVLYGGGSTAQNTVITIDPAIIHISGSDQLLDNMGDTLLLGELDMKDILLEMLGTATEKDLNEPWTKEFNIKLPDGAENVSNITTATVSVTFKDMVVKKLSVSNIVLEHLANGLVATVITRNLNVIVCGPKAQIDALTAGDLTAKVDLSYVAGEIDGRFAADIQLDTNRFSGVGIISADKPVIQIAQEVIQPTETPETSAPIE